MLFDPFDYISAILSELFSEHLATKLNFHVGGMPPESIVDVWP